MEALQALLASTGDAARDLRVNLDNLLGGGELPARARFGVALACAWSRGDAQLAAALRVAGGESGDDAMTAVTAKAAEVLIAIRRAERAGLPFHCAAPLVSLANAALPTHVLRGTFVTAGAAAAVVAMVWYWSRTS